MLIFDIIFRWHHDFKAFQYKFLLTFCTRRKIKFKIINTLEGTEKVAQSVVPISFGINFRLVSTFGYEI